MIAKTKAPVPMTNRFEEAGQAAEEQMAFYLRRAFGDSPDVFVINDLRLTDGDDAAQIDHLIVHPFGMFIVESKSISGEVVVNAHDEWVRVWGGKRQGMHSPIQQARLQGAFLRKALQNSKDRLRDKRLFGKLQPGFSSCPIDICVAISDRGIIRRDRTDPPEVCKADRVCSRIQTEIDRHRKAAGLLSKLDGDYGLWKLNSAELQRVIEFLLERHVPVRAVAPPTARPVSTVPTRIPVANSETSKVAGSGLAGNQPGSASCRHCSSADLLATYGKYGYYFKCRICEKNTPMDSTCRSCGSKGRIRKSAAEFTLSCGDCGGEQLVWTNH